MKPDIVTFILVCFMISRCRSVPYILQDAWNILTKSDPTENKCPILSDALYTVNIPHETDCDKFYICQRGKKILMTCANFLQFNEELNVCDWPENSKCFLGKTKVTHPDSKESDTAIIYKRQTECVEDQQLPHESVCNQYYRCVYGQKVLKICPDDMVFNEDIGRCDFRYNFICDKISRPVDENGDVIDDLLGDYDYYDDFFEQNFDQDSSGSKQDELVTNQCLQVTKYAGEVIFIPHETRCDTYYACIDGRKQEMICPDALEFNPKLSMCDWPLGDECIKREETSTL